VLYRDENTGAVDLAFDPWTEHVIYAALWESRQAPWENGVVDRPGSGLYKSIDGGDDVEAVDAGAAVVRGGSRPHGVTVAPSNRNRLFAVVDAVTRGRHLSIRRCGDAVDAGERDPASSAADDAATSASHPRIQTSSIVPTIVDVEITDGGRTFAGFAARRAATTTRRSGSTLRRTR
jgi:hypothetical protein